MAYLFLTPVCRHTDVSDLTHKLAKKAEVPAFFPLDIVSASAAEEYFLTHKEDDWEDAVLTAFRHQVKENNAAVIAGFTPKKIHWVNKNPSMASALNASMVLVADASEGSANKIAQQIQLVLASYVHEPMPVVAFALLNDDKKIAVKVAEKISLPYLDKSLLQNLLQQDNPQRVSPAAFRVDMMQRARQGNKRIVLPEGAEPRTVEAAMICHQKQIARCVLLAKREEVEKVAKEKHFRLPEDLEIIDPESIAHKYIEPLVEMRKHKGLTPEAAAEALKDNVFVGTMMMALDEVDGLVSGAVHTTANTIRPALQVIKTKPGAALVSSVFFMLMPNQVLVYGDCAVNPKPTAAELADIAIQSADSAKAFGIAPKVAMISYSTGNSGTGEDVDKVKEATRLVQEKRPDILIDGPLQYDAASVLSVGQQKAPNSPVAGQANVFIFPDLNTGNCTYKAVQRSAHILSIGPMLQGLNKPVNDLSRGALVGDIVYTIAITAIQAQQ